VPPLTPLDIVKRTPKTNCRECGYPSCLAFGAAVTTQGISLNKCPYINKEGLDDSSTATINGAHERDLELVAHLKSKVAPLNFKNLAVKLGATYKEEGSLQIGYLGWQVTIAKNGILLDGQEPEDPRDQILLYNYVFMGGGTLPDHLNWIGMESMPNSISKVKTLERYSEKPLAELFNSHTIKQIIAVIQKFGGVVAKESNADISCIIPLLPLLPVNLHFWESDDEDGFEARVKILFDHNALQFLDIESLVFATERLAERFGVLLKAP